MWGTATSAHQVEGMNRNNEWWEWEQQADRILHGHRSDEACGWWSGKWEEDLDRAAGCAQNAHRMSIEWSRIEPHPAVWDEDAMGVYRKILKGMLERDITPMVTLLHFTHPLWFIERGGWLRDDSIGFFKRFVSKCVEDLKDLVSQWVTINEPNVYAFSAYAEGSFPPGEKDYLALPRVLLNLLRAHGAAYETIHAAQPEAQVGIAHHYRGFTPNVQLNPLEGTAARLRHEAFNNTFPAALQTGRFRLLHWRSSIPEAKGTQDFFGLNYYTRERVKIDLRMPDSLIKPGAFSDDADLSPSGFIANDPGGFWAALNWAKSNGLPLIITENGVEDPEDRIRSRYLACHLHELWKAANFNWQVRGYFHWTLVDNFEWERGWTQRFGLWEMDPRTLKRKKRLSADFYADICAQNGLTSEAVHQFAPECLDQIFPPRGSDDLAE